MDEPMTPMERRVVEYHVWKTQMRQIGDAAGGDRVSDRFLGFKETMDASQKADFTTRVVEAWQQMNALDLGKALNEYEEDCPDLPGLGTTPVQSKNSGGR